MNFYLNPESLLNCFAFPCTIVDKYIKLATDTQLKVLLYAIKNAEFNTEKIAEYFGFSNEAVKDALMFWQSCGVVSGNSENITLPADEKIKNAVKQVTKTVRPASIKPDRNEVARRGIECEEIAFLLREAELKIGKALKPNEASTLVWLYDDIGIDISIILMIFEFALKENNFSMNFVEKTALGWYDDGVRGIFEAEQKLVELAERNSAWSIICKAYGIEKRLPSVNEQKYAQNWILDWDFSNEMLKLAYDKCVDATGKLKLSYINKVLTAWHKDGIKTPEQIEKVTTEQKKPETVSYDISSIENKMLSE